MKKVFLFFMMASSLNAFSAEMGVQHVLKLGIGGAPDVSTATSSAIARLQMTQNESDLIVTEPARSQAKLNDFKILGFTTPDCEETNSIAHIWSCSANAISQAIVNP